MLKIKMKAVLWGALLALLCVLGFQIPAPAEWQRPIQPSLTGGALTCLATHPLDPTKFLLASSHKIFENGKESSWQPLWSQGDANAPIKRLFSFAVLPEIVFAITDRNIFMGNLKDRSWRAVYKDAGKNPLAFAVHPKDPNRWLLGTQKGLWETRDAGRTWAPSSLFRTSGPVPLLVFDHERLFLADEKTLYLALPESSARSVLDLSKTRAEMPSADDETPESLEAPLLYDLKIHDLIVSRRNPQELFLATSSGVFRSVDSGHRWEPLSRSGLQSAVILQLAYSGRNGLLYAATPRGIYAYDARAQKWSGLFEGLAKDRAQSLAVLNEEKLIAITGDGFVQCPLETFVPEADPGLNLSLYRPPEETLVLFKELLAQEPSAREVHKRVIRYADVANGKIQRWHTLSRVAGALPTFSFGKSQDRGNSISTYSGKYITGPEDVSKGWDADVSWDLGDTLYSSDQTSIDSREKMMVELRNDLLSEATRIYYERRRLQIDLVFTPPASEQEHLENLLRMDELTALLDAMTDGFFTKRLEAIYREKEGFNKLWEFKQTDTRGDSGLAPRDSQ